MRHISPTFNVVPKTGDPSTLILWVGIATWEDERIDGHHDLFSTEIKRVIDGGDSQLGRLHMTLDVADAVYHAVLKFTHTHFPSVRETDGHPHPASIPPASRM